MTNTRPIPVRISQATIDEAKRRGLNVAEIMRSALEQATGVKCCQSCGQAIKKKK